MEVTKTENPYLAIAEAELDKELVWIEEDNEKIAEIVRANKDEIIRLICDDIQADKRIQELIRQNIMETVREYEFYL